MTQEKKASFCKTKRCWNYLDPFSTVKWCDDCLDEGDRKHDEARDEYLIEKNDRQE